MEIEPGASSGAGSGQSPLRLGSIELSERGITEYTREGHRVLFVPRLTVERLTVAHGSTSERPIAALLGAVGGLGCGAFLLIFVLVRFLNGEMGLNCGALVMGFFPTAIGALCAHALVRRGRYLRVDTQHGSRKLMFLGAEDSASCEELVRAASQRFGYNLDELNATLPRAVQRVRKPRRS
jgi:hypothetical protein